MAAPLRKTRQDEVREKIRCSVLIRRLHEHAEGRIELTPTQVKSIEILLRKRLPDLSAVEHSGEVAHSYLVEVPTEAASSEAWESQQKQRQTLPH